MRKAAIAIPQIIALIIGLIVVVVLVYWFISSGSKGTTIGTEAECTARKTEFCVTQSPDTEAKVIEVCGSKPDDWSTFCSFISGWEPASQN